MDIKVGARRQEVTRMWGTLRVLDGLQGRIEEAEAGQLISDGEFGSRKYWQVHWSIGFFLDWFWRDNKVGSRN